MEALRALGERDAPPEIAPGQRRQRRAARSATRPQRGCDIIVLGSGDGPSIGGAVVEQVVADAPCHVAIMKAPGAQPPAYRRILVPVDGSVASRLAVELALRYAEATARS